MSHIDTISAVSAPTATAQKKESDAASQFAAILDQIKSGTQRNSDADAESKTIIERTVVTAPDGSKMLVITQVTIKPNGQRGESKVLSRQKIASPDAQTALEPEADDRKQKEIDPDYKAQWQDTGTGEAQRKYAQSGVNGLLKPGDVLSEFQ